MTTVAVTGSSGYVGRLLVERLGREPDVTRVVGIDTAEPRFTSRNFEFYRMDVRSQQLARVIDGCDVVVHLVSVTGPDPDEIRDVNIGGTRAVADAATRAGVGKFVYVSSGAVYGAHPDNDYPLTEGSPLRPGYADEYARSKAEAESIVTYCADGHPETTVTILRPAWVVGPHVPTSHAGAIDAKVRFHVRGYDPPFQAVHEEDMVGALAFVLREDLPGVFNVAADDAVDRPEELLGQRRVTLDLDRARRILDRTARVGLSVPSSQVGALMYPQVLSNEALKAAGFAPSKTTAEALRQAAAARKGWVAVGPVRFRPRRIALVGGTLGAVLVTSAVKNRRARRDSAS
jgi:nucleoside-diphosphate-sugar epimerase